jgi:hypothetical protein
MSATIEQRWERAFKFLEDARRLTEVEPFDDEMVADFIDCAEIEFELIREMVAEMTQPKTPNFGAEETK